MRTLFGALAVARRSGIANTFLGAGQFDAEIHADGPDAAANPKDRAEGL